MLILYCTYLLLSTICSADDDPADVVSALETAVANAIEKAQPSVVSVTRIRSQNGETLAIRGKATNVGEATPSAYNERPGFPNVSISPDPEAYPLPGDF